MVFMHTVPTNGKGFILINSSPPLPQKKTSMSVVGILYTI